MVLSLNLRRQIFVNGFGEYEYRKGYRNQGSCEYLLERGSLYISGEGVNILVSG